MIEVRSLRLTGGLALLGLALGAGGPALAQQPPSEEHLMEQIERARRAFQADVRGAPERPQASERDLIDQVRRMREGVGGEAAGESEAAPPLDEAGVAELRQRLGEALGVEVLGVQGIEADGRPAYAVRVMNPGGNSNDAFRVSTLIVDRDSGEVLGQLQQSVETATEFPEGGVRFQPNIDSSGLTIRQRTYR